MSLLNQIDNPDALQIQNELRLLAKKVEGSFSVITEHGITESTYKNDNGTRVHLFERGNYSYLKIIQQRKNEPNSEDVGNYSLEEIKNIEFSQNTLQIYVTMEDGEISEWNL